MEFRSIWEQVGAMEGRAFSTGRGDSFTYRYRKTYIVVSPGEQSIPRTNFEKVWRLRQQNDSRAPAPVQGAKFIEVILSDPRLMGS
jgi:hypothetical protein